MSYDYLMFKRPAWRPKWLARIEVVFLGQYAAMGTVDQVRNRIDQLLPDLRWEQRDIKTLAPSLVSLKAIKGPVWFGSGGAEIQLSADESGQVTNFQVSRTEPAQLRTLERKMGLVAFDLQQDSILGMIFR